MAYYRGKREAEAEGDAEPREERSYGHGKGQAGAGKSAEFLFDGNDNILVVPAENDGLKDGGAGG